MATSREPIIECLIVKKILMLGVVFSILLDAPIIEGVVLYAFCLHNTLKKDFHVSYRSDLC